MTSLRRIALAVGLCLLCWLLTACRDRPRTISYPDGVEVSRSDETKPPYRAVGWRRMDGGPAVCPLTLTHVGEAFGPADWADLNGLQRRGWTELAASSEEQKYLLPGLKRLNYVCGRASFAVAFDGDGRMLWLDARLADAPPYEPMTVERAGVALTLPATGPEVRQAFGNGL